MYLYKNCVFLFLLLVAAFGCTEKQQKAERPNPVLLISFDGFRYDYFEKTATPHFDKFISEGVKAEGLIPVFPTKTFPNHYAIATGLYPENNGLVGNTMYDAEFEAWYRISDRDAVEDSRWYRGEPIWNTVEKQGLKAGTLFWVGSETDIQQMHPTYWKKFDGSMPYKARIDTVVKWLSYPDEQRTDFSTLYFSGIDHAGHRYGPESDSVIVALSRADSLLGYLQSRMEQKKLWKNTNVIIVSDHGMAPLAAEKAIVLDSIMDTTLVERITWGPVSMIQPKTGATQKVFNQLKAKEDHYKVYKKEDLPERYHLKNSRRIPPIILVPDLGYMIMEGKYQQPFIESLPAGMHGFDNDELSMQGILLARGPSFKNGFKMGSIRNVHLYELMTHLLNIQPAPNDGSLDSVRVMLKR